MQHLPSLCLDKCPSAARGKPSEVCKGEPWGQDRWEQSPGNLRRALIISARERVPRYRTVYFTYHIFFLSLSFFFFFFFFLCSVAQSCPTLCDAMDCSLPGSSVHGILQARTLEWVPISSSRGFSHLRDRTRLSCTARGFFTTESPGKPKVLNK